MIVQPSFREAVLTFFRRKFTFLLVFGTVCVAGAGYLALATPLFLSTTSMVLRFDQHDVPDIDRTRQPTQSLGSNERRAILYSDADILRSPDIARQAINEVGLQRLFPKIAAKDQDKGRAMDDAIKEFSNDLVVNVGLQSDVISVSFLHPKATMARAAVQSLLDRFYAQEAVIYANPQIKFAKDEAARAQQKLNDAQNALAAFREQYKIADLNGQVSQLLQQRTDVESRLSVAQGVVAQAQQKEKALQLLLAAVPSLVKTTAQGETYRGIDEVDTQIAQLEAQRNKMAATYRPGSPVFRNIDAELASLRASARRTRADARGRDSTQPNMVYENIKTDLLRATAEANSGQQPVDILTKQLASINQRLTDLDKQRTRYDDLQRAVRIQDDTYRTLAIRYEESRVEANRNAQKISAAAVIAQPSLPSKPARPRRKLVALGTVLAGFLLACCAVFGLEAIDDRLRSPTDVAQVLRLPVLATFGTDA